MIYSLFIFEFNCFLILLFYYFINLLFYDNIFNLYFNFLSNFFFRNIVLQTFVEFNDVKKLENLIFRGQTLGGSVLLMCVVTAQKHLNNLKKFLLKVGVTQSVVRGYNCRQKILRERSYADAHNLYLLKVKRQSK